MIAKLIHNLVSHVKAIDLLLGLWNYTSKNSWGSETNLQSGEPIL